MTPTIAIAVPIGAYHPLLRDCLASLAAQTPRPVISTLDASRDPRAAAVIDEFQQLIAYRRVGPDSGQTAAILEGWEKAPGDILGWLNADDALYPGALSIVAARFSDRPDTDVFYGHSVIINDDHEIVGYHWAVEPPSDAILSGCIISQPSCFFRRSAYQAAGGLDASLHYTMDWDLWTRLWTNRARFEFVDEVLSRVLWSREAKTGGFGSRRRKELNRIIDANNPPARRLKSRVGFGLHHVLEYVAPRAIANAARSARKSTAIHGLGRSGEIIGEAQVPLVHYRPNDEARLMVTLDVGGGSVTVEAAGRQAALAQSGAADLTVPMKAAEVLNVRFRAVGDGRARLKSIRIG